MVGRRTARVLAVGFACALIVALAFAPQQHAASAAAASTDYQQLYVRAHGRAVELRRERDDLQQRLAARVREVHAVRRALVHQPSSVEALRLAAVAYRVSFRLLYRIASCESTGAYVGDTGPVSERTLYAHAKNAHSTARGLGQFLDTTWAGSPYTGFDVDSPYANALAIAYYVARGDQGWQWAASAGCWQ